ncbi:MAG TPA: hypothetical protein VGQ76_16180 [Thermoanaerobaculia bacterium]|jgi:hypothetical protein|nr:hypothetical protein [Thermoanaerobaculia bacterium]
MISWNPEATRSNHMYRCAYCNSITTATQKTVGRRVHESLANAQLVIAYDCGECGSTTCFAGSRQIPSVPLYPYCHPLLAQDANARIPVHPFAR